MRAYSADRGRGLTAARSARDALSIAGRGSRLLFDNQRPLDVIVILSIVVPLVVLGIVCWIFWRARNDP